MTTRTNGVRQTFASDERGTIAPIFGLMAIVLMFIAGMAIDYGRITHSESKIRTAADGAALAAGRAMLDGRLSDDEVKDLGRAFFNQNVTSSGKFGTINGVEILLDRPAGSVTVNVDAEVPMTITRVGGFNDVDLGVTSMVLSDQHDIELGMALDVTGSMAGSKIADLKTAAKDLVDILLPDGGTPNKVRIGLAPYAASVNAGSYAGTVTNGLSSRCVHERGGTEAFTDAAPGPGIWLGTRSTLSCPSAQVIPMTNDKPALKANIDTYRASGATGGHIGAAWAWYLVSPEWSTIWPAASRPEPYNDGKTIKAIVLMTDGQFNTQYVSANGSSDAQARALCSAMKGDDVVIYAVGFMSPPAAEALLQNCASTADHYFNASNGEELRAAFIEIAHQLNNLRLTQ